MTKTGKGLIGLGVGFALGIAGLFYAGVIAKDDLHNADINQTKEKVLLSQRLDKTSGVVGHLGGNVDANTGKINNIQTQINTLVKGIDVTNSDVNAKLAALNKATMLIQEADAKQGVLLNNFINTLSASLKKEFNTVYMTIDNLETDFEDKLDAIEAKADADLMDLTNRTNVALSMVSTKEVKKLERKLAHKKTFIDPSRTDKRIDNLEGRLKRAIKRSKKEVVADGGWFFQGPKSQLKKNARNAKDIKKLKAEIVRIKAEGLQAKRLAKIEALEAELDKLSL